MKPTTFIYLLLVFTSVARSEEIICHFDLETDEIGVPSCDGNECTYEIVFPNYENHRIIRANLELHNGDDYLTSDLALEKHEDKASSLLYFSKSHSLIQLAVYYQLKGCVGLVKYQIHNGILNKIK